MNIDIVKVAAWLYIFNYIIRVTDTFIKNWKRTKKDDHPD